MSGVTFDAGGLVALDRNDRRVLALVARATERGMRITIPATALAQAIRNPARQARLVRLIRQAGTTFDRDQLFHKIFYCKDHQIALDSDGVRLETISMEHDSARAGYRVFPYRYEIRENQVIRVAPVGFDAHDFVGEGGNLPWDESKKWSDPAQLG